MLYLREAIIKPPGDREAPTVFPKYFFWIPGL
jgi:hypothetical protein